MASDDIYVRKDVYEADQRALIAEIRLGNEEILKALEQFKAEVNGKFEQISSRFDRLETRIDALDAKVEYTHTYMGWGFATLGIIVAIAVVILPASKMVKEFFRPSVTIEKVKEISRAIAEEVVDARLQARQ